MVQLYIQFGQGYTLPTIFNNMKKFFTRSFIVLSLVSFVVGVYFLVRKDEMFAYAYNTLGTLLVLTVALIDKVVPEED